MTLSILVCVADFFVLLWILRKDRISLGLPIAYLFGLLLLHVPGAIAHWIGGDVLFNTDLTELGIGFTAIGATAFVVGVWSARFRTKHVPAYRPADHREFWMFCLIGGWVFTFAFSNLPRIPSVSAALDKGGAIWMLGVLLGLQAAMRQRDGRWVAIWLGALVVYPVLMLLFGGFVSYGATVVMIVISGLAISTRSFLRVVVGAVVVSVLAFNTFLNYFQHRNDIRDSVWGGSSLEDRIDVSANIFRDFEWFDPGNQSQLSALDQRLNQNYFAGLAAERIQEGQVDYLYGRSVGEGLMSLVPRIFWPDKPVFGGSPQIVSEMTGLYLSEDTAWGVGNVMEFHVNFGIPGLIVGFLVLGWAIGTLDRKATLAERSGDFGRALVYFLPGAALVQPIGSMVELVGGAAAAAVAGYGWRWGWNLWSRRHSPPRGRAEPRVAAPP